MITVDDDSVAYAACIATATGFCINHDKANFKVQWHVFQIDQFDTSPIGKHKVFTNPTLTALNQNNDLLTEVYTNDDSRSFLIDVHWMCLDETDLATSVNLIGTPEFLDPWYYMGQDKLGYTYQYS